MHDLHFYFENHICILIKHRLGNICCPTKGSKDQFWQFSLSPINLLSIKTSFSGTKKWKKKKKIRTCSSCSSTIFHHLLLNKFVPSTRVHEFTTCHLSLSIYIYKKRKGRGSRWDRSITIHDPFYIYITLVSSRGREKRKKEKFRYASRRRNGRPKQIFDSRLCTSSASKYFPEA